MGPDSVAEKACRVMSDDQLAKAIEDIRGNPKRGSRPLRLGEIVALSALYREYERRHGVSKGF